MSADSEGFKLPVIIANIVSVILTVLLNADDF